MSGLIGGLFNQFAGRQVQPNAITDVLQQMLGEHHNGIASLISRFENAGLGEHVQSWIDGEDKMPMTGNQVDQVFSPDEVNRWASHIGIDPDKLRVIMAEALPHVIDYFTPDKRVPQENTLPDITSLIGRFFGEQR